jgi:hypothetical protein
MSDKEALSQIFCAALEDGITGLEMSATGTSRGFMSQKASHTNRIHSLDGISE